MHNVDIEMTWIYNVPEPYFEPVTIGTQVFEFTHLEPFTFTFQSQRAKKWLRVHVTFKDHCFTKKYKIEEHVPEEPVFHAQTDKPRLFCRIRYRLSQSLPAIVQGLNHPKVKVWETASRRNWAYSITIQDPAGPYHVFFEVRRPAAHQKHLQDINVVVESAYHEDPDEGPPNLIGEMAFYLLCGKIYAGEPTSTRR